MRSWLNRSLPNRSESTRRSQDCRTEKRRAAPPAGANASRKTQPPDRPTIGVSGRPRAPLSMAQQNRRCPTPQGRRARRSPATGRVATPRRRGDTACGPCSGPTGKLAEKETGGAHHLESPHGYVTTDQTRRAWDQRFEDTITFAGRTAPSGAPTPALPTGNRVGVRPEISAWAGRIARSGSFLLCPSGSGTTVTRAAGRTPPWLSQIGRPRTPPAGASRSRTPPHP